MDVEPCILFQTAGFLIPASQHGCVAQVRQKFQKSFINCSVSYGCQLSLVALLSTLVNENRSWTVVKVAKTDFIQERLQSGKRDLGIELGSTPSTRRRSRDFQPRSWFGGQWMEKLLSGDPEVEGILPRLTKQDLAEGKPGGSDTSQVFTLHALFLLLGSTRRITK